MWVVGEGRCGEGKIDSKIGGTKMTTATKTTGVRHKVLTRRRRLWAVAKPKTSEDDGDEGADDKDEERRRGRGRDAKTNVEGKPDLY